MTGDWAADAGIRTAWRRAWAMRLGMAFLCGVPTLVAFIVWLAPVEDGERWGSVAEYLLAFGAYVAVAVAVVFTVDRRRWAVVERWAGGAPDADDGRRIVLRMAWCHGVESMAVWVAGSAVFAATDYAQVQDTRRTAILFAGALLGGLTVSSATYLLCDVTLRPAVGHALEGRAVAGRAAISVRRRLVAIWLASGGVPLTGIALGVLWENVYDQGRTGLIVAIVVAGVIAGYIVSVAATRSIGEPVEAVREALARVEAGDLSAAVEIPVDDTSELGLLQVGFNRMVAAMRERRALEDMFGRHVGIDVARRALERGIDLTGEAHEATVVIVDLIGSTTLVEQGPPARGMAVVNSLFDSVVRACDAEGGWITQFQGDSAVCVFGVPVPQTDHASRALRAVACLLDELDAKRPTMPELDVGVGVASGIVIAGHVGAEQRVSYTVVGDPANVAARLCELAKLTEGRALVDASTIVGADVEGWTRHDVITLRGRTNPTECYVRGG
ncbi:MAG: adenylate/guanylate cyclase domain-containing protein [Acidimicrobiales bacterium]